ncbi:transglutaminase domain-containing protein [Lacinutrix undariae]
MKYFYLVIIALFTLQGGVAQNYKFGKVSKEDFNKYKTPASPDDNATVIYRSQTINFEYADSKGFFQQNEIHERILIHNKEGFDWATKKVRIYNKSAANSELLRNLKGYTFTYSNGKVEKTKLKSEGMFEEIANQYWKINTFTMPNISEGCIIEYTYVVESPYLSINDIDVQYTIPIAKFELEIRTPEYFKYSRVLNPRATFIPKIEESERERTVSYTARIEESTLNASRSLKSEVLQAEFTFAENIITADLDNVPALKIEPLVNNLDNYRAKLVMEHTSTKYPNSIAKYYSTTWDDVTKTIYDDNDFGVQLNRKGFYTEDLETLVGTQKGGDTFKKAQAILNFVKRKVKWNGFVGYTAENGVRKAYIDGSGNVADINLLLVSMLREAGIKANPVLVSTKSNGIPLFPTRQGFNYVICLIEDTGFTALLDATSPYSTFNILPDHVINWQGRVIREQGSSTWINLSGMPSSKKTVSLNVKMNNDLSVEGKVRTHQTNYFAYSYRSVYAKVTAESHAKNLEKNKGDISITNLTVENDTDPLQPLKVNYDYKLNGAVEDLGGKLYFSPLLFFGDNENPLKQEERIYPIDLGFPKTSKYIVNIMLPEGYKVESLPKSEASKFNTNEGLFSYIIKENGKYLQLTVNIDFNTSLVQPADYDAFKAFYTLITTKESEKVVLTKI